jgi:hypothetical protein
MPLPDTSRRLARLTLDQDIDSLNGLTTITTYVTTRAEATPERLQKAYQLMLEKQKLETETYNQYRAAADAVRLAEWEFHNCVLAMKESVRGQFGSDSNESQAIGYKKKSSRKRPVRQKVTTAV